MYCKLWMIALPEGPFWKDVLKLSIYRVLDDNPCFKVFVWEWISFYWISVSLFALNVGPNSKMTQKCFKFLFLMSVFKWKPASFSSLCAVDLMVLWILDRVLFLLQDLSLSKAKCFKICTMSSTAEQRHVRCFIASVALILDMAQTSLGDTHLNKISSRIYISGVQELLFAHHIHHHCLAFLSNS